MSCTEHGAVTPGTSHSAVAPWSPVSGRGAEDGVTVAKRRRFAKRRAEATLARSSTGVSAGSAVLVDAAGVEAGEAGRGGGGSQGTSELQVVRGATAGRGAEGHRVRLRWGGWERKAWDGWKWSGTPR